MAELARRLPALGFDPLVLCRRRPAAPLELKQGLPLPVEIVPWLGLNSWCRAASFDWGARRRLSGRVRLVHGQGDLIRQDVLTVNNCDAAAAHYVPDGRRPSAGVRYIRKKQFAPGGCRIMVAISDRVRRDISEFHGVPPETIRRVYPGADLERFHPSRREAARIAFLKQTRWPEETAVVLMVLSGDPAKRNFSLAARAVALLSQKRPAGLLLVGNVDWKEDEACLDL